MQGEVMAAEVPQTTEVRPATSRWRQWLAVVLAAAGLLVVSEALWLWQSWPVRQLLQPTVPAAQAVSGR
jgi:type VI secretion system protein ImpK